MWFCGLDKAFRHGDIENILATLAKTTGKVAGGGGLLGFASSVLSSGSGGSKFDKGDIKKVYFVSLSFSYMIAAVSLNDSPGKLAQRLFASKPWGGINWKQNI